MTLTYIAMHEAGIDPKSADLADLREIIKNRDEPKEEFYLACYNDSKELAAFLEPYDFCDHRLWKFLVFVMIPESGVILSYLPCRLVEIFKNQAKQGILSYALFSKILGI